ncbi:hypothetical protein EXS54_00305 [Patescibacteria group bacterium]|nr:hypothetical protein [Patescibacteria group bacterium]
MTQQKQSSHFHGHTGRVALVALIVALSIVAAVSTFAAEPTVENQPYAVPDQSASQVNALEITPQEEASLEGEVDVSESDAESIPEIGTESNGTLQDSGGQG